MKRAYEYNFQKGDFVFENKDAVVLTGVEALKQWIEKCIRTQLNRYPMYNGTGYGANIEDLTISSHFRCAKSQPNGCPPFLAVSGHSFGIDFVESELRRAVRNFFCNFAFYDSF